MVRDSLFDPIGYPQGVKSMSVVLVTIKFLKFFLSQVPHVVSPLGYLRAIGTSPLLFASWLSSAGMLRVYQSLAFVNPYFG